RCTGAARFTELSIENAAGERTFDFNGKDTIRIRMTCQAFEQVENLKLFFALQSSSFGETIASVNETISSEPVSKGTARRFTLEIPSSILQPGDYVPYFWLGNLQGVSCDVLDSRNASL